MIKEYEGAKLDKWYNHLRALPVIIDQSTLHREHGCLPQYQSQNIREISPKIFVFRMTWSVMSLRNALQISFFFYLFKGYRAL